MALTSDEMVSAFNTVGIDTPEKVSAVLGYLLAIVAATRAGAAIAQAQAEKDKVVDDQMAKISAAQTAAQTASAAEQAALDNLVTLFG